MRYRFLYGWALAAVLAVMASAPGWAAGIAYTAVDLADGAIGQDRWQYRYLVSGAFVQFGGFNIVFDPALYESLEEPAPAVNADWTIILTQPDSALGAEGVYTATTSRSNPSLADPFVVSFVWRGPGTPGSQVFEVFDESFFPPIETGRTSAPSANAVPAPGTLALFAAGLLLFAGWGRHHLSRRHMR